MTEPVSMSEEELRGPPHDLDVFASPSPECRRLFSLHCERAHAGDWICRRRSPERRVSSETAEGLGLLNDAWREVRQSNLQPLSEASACADEQR